MHTHTWTHIHTHTHERRLPSQVQWVFSLVLYVCVLCSSLAVNWTRIDVSTHTILYQNIVQYGKRTNIAVLLNRFVVSATSFFICVDHASVITICGVSPWLFDFSLSIIDEFIRNPSSDRFAIVPDSSVNNCGTRWQSNCLNFKPATQQIQPSLSRGAAIKPCSQVFPHSIVDQISVD